MSLDEPHMSDRTLLVSVEDLINIAFGPTESNVINFKVIQTILHILARQQRMLQQRVEIRITEVKQESPPVHKKIKRVRESEDSSPSPSTHKVKKRVPAKPDGPDKGKDKVEKEKARAEKEAQRREEKVMKEQQKAVKSAEKEKEKAGKEEQKELQRIQKEKDKAERSASKEREKAEKEKEKAERSASKEREKAERAADKAERSASKEREKAEKEKEKAERSASKEREKAERAAEKEKEKAERSSSKEREKAERAAEKEREKAERSASKEREKAEKEKEKADRSASKEREKAERAAEKDKEKAERSASKEREKAERAAEKDKEKAERSASKEREKAERAAEKEKEKAERSASKEREKEERSASKEREKVERAAEKEREKADKTERKEKERAEKDAAKAQKEKDRRDRSPPPATEAKGMKKRLEPVPSVNISEVERGKEKVLVVEKGPTTRSESRSRGGSIDVVTQSQFALLEAAVRGLQQRAAPLGELRMPDNKQLKSDLARGSASLTDTMQAMQVNARVKAAEEAIDRMAGLLTKLAAAGAVPEALADQVAEAKREAERTLTSDTDDGMPIKARPSTARKSVAIDPVAKTSALARPSTAHAGEPTPRGSVSTVMGRASLLSRPSSTVSTVPDPKVTKSEMEDVIKTVRDDLWKGMNSMTTKATAVAENAMHTAKAVSDKLDVALQLDRRISTLHALVADYADQLSGFDAGLTTQMQSFQEQMVQIRGDLAGGLKLLENVNNNAETAAVLELTERYEELAAELERTLSAHRLLSSFQGQLGDELRSLVESVEMLREQKADREEVIDGLRDKADSSRLAGLLSEAQFAAARGELQRRLDLCHDKFRRQDSIWMGAMKDLLKTTDLKAEIIDLLSMREDTQRQLRELHERARLLAAVLGEPKAALLTRQLASGALCGACGAAALMQLRDPAQGVPPALPALRPPPPDPEPCLAALGDWITADPEDDRHMCLRWCGGSHTLMSERVAREQAPPALLQAAPTRKFTDYGMDGRLYMMEEELQPCLECNMLLEKQQEDLERPASVGEEGAGDQGHISTA